MKRLVWLVVILAVILTATAATAQYDGAATPSPQMGKVGGAVSGPPTTGWGQSPSMGTVPLETPPSAPAHQKQFQKIVVNNYYPRKTAGHAATKTRIKRVYVTKPSTATAKAQATINFAPPPGDAAKSQPAAPAERKQEPMNPWIPIAIVGAICATIYGCTYLASRTEERNIAAETARINEAAERREAREAAERAQTTAIERERLGIMREAIGNQGHFSPENSPEGLSDTRTDIIGVGVLTSRADNRGSQRIPTASNANTAAPQDQAIDPNDVA